MYAYTVENILQYVMCIKNHSLKRVISRYINAEHPYVFDVRNKLFSHPSKLKIYQCIHNAECPSSNDVC